MYKSLSTDIKILQIYMLATVNRDKLTNKIKEFFQFVPENSVMCLYQVKVQTSSLQCDLLDLTQFRSSTYIDYEVLIKCGSMYLINGIEFLNDIPIIQIKFLNFSQQSYFEYLTYHSQIDSLSLNRKPLVNNDVGLKLLMRMLVINDFLTELDLAQNNLGAKEDAVFFLSSGLKQNKAITILDLSSNLLGQSVNFSVLLDALKENKYITKLDLSKNKINNEHFLKINEIFKENKLKTCFLAYNNIWENLLISLKSTFMQEFKSLIHLDFGHNNGNLHISSYFYIKNFLIFQNTLKILNLEANNLGLCPRKLDLICAGIRKNGMLENIILSKNNFGQDIGSCKILFNCLKKDKKLCEVDLSINELGGKSEVIKMIKEYLASSTTLTMFYLMINNINNEEFTQIERGVLSNPSLQELYAFGNTINERNDKKYSAKIMI
jgi:hypothetical protein